MRFEEFIETSRRTRSVEELERIYVDAIAAEGYENSVLVSLRGRRLGEIGWYNFPEGYFDAYVENRWDRIDPILASALRASKPFHWNDVVNRAKLSAEQIQFMGACRELKVHSGIAFPFHGPNQRLEIMSISRQSADAAATAPITLLHAVSLQTWNRYQELTDEQAFADEIMMSKQNEIVLTQRETDVLNWCKDGKTRPEIAKILSISAKTVEFHLKNCMDKLGASNQVSAVVIALQRRLIDL